MNAIRETQKKYCSRSMTAAILIGFALILAGQNPIGKGLILGTLFSVLNFIIIGETLPLRVGQGQKKTFTLNLLSIIFRYLLLAAPIVIALKSDTFNLAAAVVGIFMVQLTIISEHIFFTLFRKTERNS
jgi:hypothetical protein